MPPPDHSFPPSIGVHGRGQLWPTAGLVVSALIFVVCAVISALSFRVEVAPEIIVGDAMQPRVFPIFLMVVIAVLNTILIALIIRYPSKAPQMPPIQTWASLALMGLFCVIAITLDMLLALAVVLFLLSRVFGERRIRVAAAVAILTPAIIFFAFDQLLGVRFPRGILTEIYY